MSKTNYDLVFQHGSISKFIIPQYFLMRINLSLETNREGTLIHKSLLPFKKLHGSAQVLPQLKEPI